MRPRRELLRLLGTATQEQSARFFLAKLRSLKQQQFEATLLLLFPAASFLRRPKQQSSGLRGQFRSDKSNSQAANLREEEPFKEKSTLACCRTFIKVNQPFKKPLAFTAEMKWQIDGGGAKVPKRGFTYYVRNVLDQQEELGEKVKGRLHNSWQAFAEDFIFDSLQVLHVAWIGVFGGRYWSRGRRWGGTWNSRAIFQPWIGGM